MKLNKFVAAKTALSEAVSDSAQKALNDLVDNLKKALAAATTAAAGPTAAAASAVAEAMAAVAGKFPCGRWMKFKTNFT